MNSTLEVNRAIAPTQRIDRPRLLMCAPDHYGIEYEINPWMQRAKPPDRPLAVRQWGELYRLLTDELHCDVQLIPQWPNCPDMVFTANAALVVDDLALVSRFRNSERMPEELHFKRWFIENGYRVLEPPAGVWFEGEGDALIAGETVLAGYMKRSDIYSHQWMSETLMRPVLSLGLCDSRWYHLDTCLFPLKSDLLVIYPGAFDEYGLAVLRNRFETIEVSEREALLFACNSIVLGSDVVMPANCPDITSILSNRGYRFHEVDMSEFIKAGGAAKCLTLVLNVLYGLPAARPTSTALSSTGPS